MQQQHPYNNDRDWEEVGRQLRCPSGDDGLKTADYMQLNNAYMIEQTLNFVKENKGKQVLELGPGNGKHLHDLIADCPDVVYSALDISELMVTEMQKNTEHFAANIGAIKLYDGTNVPFDADFFDQIFTVNTIYFWQDPVALLKELYRCSQTEAALFITFADKEFMLRLPFTAHLFKLYTNDEVVEMLQQSGWKLEFTETFTEIIPAKDNVSLMERTFSVVKALK